MQWSRIFAGLAIGLATTLSTFGEAAADANSRSIPKVALVGSELAETGEAALGLAEASLSTHTNLVLVDRSAIQTVLREQNLLVNGFADADDAIRLGQLLAADLFIHVESIPEQKALAVVAFETAQGIRLVDGVVVGDDADKLAGALAAKVDRAVEKWGAPAGKSTVMALMSVRNVDLPKGRSAECDTLGTLLERRLLGSPDVVVVERKRLENLNRDHEITMDRPEERLLSAPVLLELDVSQSGSEGGLQATAFLSDPKGAELGNVHAEAQNLSELADKLCADILNILKKGATPPPAAPGLEAARFFRMACFWKAQARPDLTLAAAEAAFALDPTNSLMQVLLANALFVMANVTRVEARPDSLAYAARGIALSRQPSGNPTFSDPEQKSHFAMLGADNVNFFREFGKTVGKSRKEIPFTKEESATYAEFCREWLAQSQFSPEAAEAPSGWDLLLFVNDYSQYFPDPESAWQVLAQQVKHWSQERVDKEPAHIPPALLTWLVTAGDSENKPLSSGVYRIRADLWAFLAGHENPLLRLYGRCGRIVDAARSNEVGNWAEDAASQEFLSELHADLLAQNDSNGIPREQIYQVAQFAIQRSGRQPGAWKNLRYERTQQQFREMMGLFQVMLKAGDVRGDVITAIRNPLLNINSLGSRELGEKSLVELDAAMAEATNHPAGTFTAEELQELGVFHDWVREKVEPGSTLPPPATNVKIEPVTPLKINGDLLGYAAVLGDGSGAYVLSVHGKPTTLLMQKWTLESRASILLGKIVLKGQYNIGSRVIPIAGVVDACLGARIVPVAVRDEGVFLFDRSSTAVEALQDTTSLPVTHPLSVGILGQKLYVGTDDGYLISFDLETRAAAILVASSRKEKKSPFDDGPPVHISGIFPDPARGRIVFVASVVDAEGDLGMAVSDMGGIWEYRLDTGQFKQLISFRHRPDELKWCEMVDDDSFVMQVSSYGTQTVRYSLSSDSMDVLSTVRPGGQLGGAESRMLQNTRLNQPPPEVLPIDQRQASISAPFLARGEWLWTANPWGRLSMKTYQWEKLPPFAMPDGSARYIEPHVAMVPIGSNQILLADQYDIWLMSEDQ